MEDRVPLRNRKSRIAKFNLENVNSFDDFKAINSSTGIYHDSEPNNELTGPNAGVSNIGTPNDKQNMLTDDTAALFGGTKTVDETLKAVSAALKVVPPPGTIAHFGGVFPPDGWLVANGASLSGTAYSRLAGYIGKLHGGYFLASPPGQQATSCAYSNDGKWFAIGYSSSVMVYDTTKYPYDYKRTLTLPGLIVALEFSPNGTHLAVGHQTSPYFTTYDTTTWTSIGNPSTLPSSQPTKNYSIAYRPNGMHMAIASASHGIYIYNTTTVPYTYITSFTLSGAQSYSVAYSPDSRHLTIGMSSSPWMRIYSISGTTYTQLGSPATMPTGTPTALDYSPDGTRLAIVSGQNEIMIYDTTSELYTYLLRTPNVGFQPSGCEYNYDGSLLATIGSNVKIFETANYTPLSTRTTPPPVPEPIARFRLMDISPLHIITRPITPYMTRKME